MLETHSVTSCMSTQLSRALQAVEHFARGGGHRAIHPLCKLKVFPFLDISSLTLNLNVAGNFRGLWDAEKAHLVSFVMSNLSEKFPNGKTTSWWHSSASASAMLLALTLSGTAAGRELPCRLGAHQP